MNERLNGLSLVALGLIILFGANIVADGLRQEDAASFAAQNIVDQAQRLVGYPPPVEDVGADQVQSQTPDREPDPDAFAAPYADYVLTQGLHGFSYGHMAIDIAAGKGAPILSPINGEVADLYVDQYGNPTLILENERWRVTLLHGIYQVEIGEKLRIGEVLGEESNKGYTTDMAGRSCANRNCGYHTHLNVFDKRVEENVNALLLLPSK